MNQLLFAISACFSLWVILNLILWTNIHSDIMLFAWSFLRVLSSLISILSIYFIYVFLEKKDVSLLLKSIFLILAVPIIILSPTYVNLSGFNISSCDAFMFEGSLFQFSRIFFGVLAMIWIFVLLVRKYRKAEVDFRKQILLMGIGIESFLFSFFIVTFLAAYLTDKGILADSRLEFYGLFGMTFFMGMLAYLIVRFKVFNVKLIGAQALVVAQFILIASMFFFAQSVTNQILVCITLLGVTLMGGYLIRSVKEEIKRKEELQKLSDSLATANQRLKELDLTKSEFISIASHQLRTPLTAIKGYISLLLEGSYGQVSPPVMDILNKLYSVNNRLVHLVEDLLNVSRIEAGRIQYSFAPTQMEPLIVELIEMFTATAKEKQLSLKMQLAKKPLPLLTIDPNKIKEVVSNLIDNALKYTKEGGVTVTLEEAPKVARIIVSDTGIGIHPEDKKNLFEKFLRSKETTKMVVSGAGLGLYVGKSFVEAHGGKIWAESPGPNQGSRFIIELPLVNPNIHAGTSDQPSTLKKKASASIS
jgi:signal transduction histidine kinase